MHGTQGQGVNRPSLASSIAQSCGRGDNRCIIRSETEAFKEEIGQGEAVGVGGRGGSCFGPFQKGGPQGQEDISHVGMWGRDCLVEEMAGAKDLRWGHAGQVPGAGEASVTKAE